MENYISAQFLRTALNALIRKITTGFAGMRLGPISLNNNLILLCTLMCRKSSTCQGASFQAKVLYTMNKLGFSPAGCRYQYKESIYYLLSMREAVFLHSAEELEGHTSPRRSPGVSSKRQQGLGRRRRLGYTTAPSLQLMSTVTSSQDLI